MEKGISPLVATVLLIAFTLSIAGLLGGWLTSLTKEQTTTITTGATKTVNCSSSILDIVQVVCSSTNQQLRVAINNIGQIELYDFSTFANINSTLYSNSTGGPNSTSPLRTGEQIILLYGCSSSTTCVSNTTVSKVRVSPGNCPSAWTEENPNVKCT